MPELRAYGLFGAVLFGCAAGPPSTSQPPRISEVVETEDSHKVQGCAPTWNESYDRYRQLSRHPSTPERDTEIGVLEDCRLQFVEAFWTMMPKLVKELQQGFGETLEETFEGGGLAVNLEGSTLQIRIKGTFEDRARHSQMQVEEWCADDSAYVFSEIVFEERHGTFSCVPVGTLSKRELYEQLMQQRHAYEPLAL